MSNIRPQTSATFCATMESKQYEIQTVIFDVIDYQ